MKVTKLWKFKYKASILGIEIADINGNGQSEIIAYTKTGILLFISLSGKLLHEEIISKDLPLWHLRICDIDSDGRFELILGGMDGYYEFLNVILHIIWSFSGLTNSALLLAEFL